MAVSCADLLGNTTQRWQSVFGARSERLRTHFEVPWRAMCVDPGLSVPGSWAALFAGNPFRTVGGIANELDVAYTTARRAIDRLEAAGIVSLVGPAKGNRVYCARAMLEILDPPNAGGRSRARIGGCQGRCRLRTRLRGCHRGGAAPPHGREVAGTGCRPSSSPPAPWRALALARGEPLRRPGGR